MSPSEYVAAMGWDFGDIEYVADNGASEADIEALEGDTDALEAWCREQVEAAQ